MKPPGQLLDAAKGQGSAGTKVFAQGSWVIVNPFLSAAVLRHKEVLDPGLLFFFFKDPLCSARTMLVLPRFSLPFDLKYVRIKTALWLLVCCANKGAGEQGTSRKDGKKKKIKIA